MSRIRRGAAGALAFALLVPSGALAAGPSSVTIDSVGGRAVSGGKVTTPLSGVVQAKGRATAGAPTTAVKPLVADAGDSAFVRAGDSATLIGAAFGGTAPYTFRWTASGVTLEGASSPTALLKTTSTTAPGTYTATLTVRDAAGRTATDTVKSVVYAAAADRKLLEKTSDETPGTLVTGETIEYPVVIPPGTTKFTALSEWTLDVNDFDLYVYDPKGVERDNDAGSVPQTSETVTITDPEPGTWTVELHKFLTGPDTVKTTVTAMVAPADPRPRVTAGGPYRFLVGATQSIAGTLAGGAAPVTVAWDTDSDGRFETAGLKPTLKLGQGRHLVTVKATDAKGLERRETTSVLVADQTRLAADTTAITVIAVADSGINPYHSEFSAATYPDPDVLRLTRNFTRHPSEYIPGFPKDTKAVDITIGQGYYPKADEPKWKAVQRNELYWIKGTKIIGAIAAGAAGSNVAADQTPIVDDDGHGTGSASVSAGNRYGYCPTCLVVLVEALDETKAAAYPWVDISSNSFGYVGGAPVGPLLGPNTATKAAVERGQTVLFAAGNGVGNAFDVPIATYGSDQTGNDWALTVGALRRDNQRAIIGDGIPVHLSSFGDGNIPSACRTGTVQQCTFGGTSAATPLTAGVFGTVLTAVRRELGDDHVGQRSGQVIAEGFPIPGSIYLKDGKLTRAELREAVLKTAFPLNTGNALSPYPYTATAPYTNPESNVLFEGYGAATPASADRAIAVLLGKAPLPDRSTEDRFFALDRQIRDTLYGGYDRDGDGDVDSEALESATFAGLDLDTVEGTLAALRIVARRYALENRYALEVPRYALGANTITQYLHRVVSAEPGKTAGCAANVNEKYLDSKDTAGDLEPCFEARVTSIPAAFRPLAVFASSERLGVPLAKGSDVNVTLYIASELPSMVTPFAVLNAGDREIGRGEAAPAPVVGSGTGPGSNVQGNGLPDGGLCKAMGEACWNRFVISFKTARPAFAGETLSLQIGHLGMRAWAYGFEGAHASKVQITPAALPATGFAFGTTITSPARGSSVTEGTTAMAGGRVSFPDRGSEPTGVGDGPQVRKVWVSVNDATFANPINAAIDAKSGTWSAPLGKLPVGTHTVRSKAIVNGVSSAVATSTFTVVSAARVEWQVVNRNAAPKATGWRPATGLASWAATFDTRSYGAGARTLIVRLVRDGVVLAQSSVQLTFR